jgi:hypothetical protein
LGVGRFFHKLRLAATILVPYSCGIANASAEKSKPFRAGIFVAVTPEAAVVYQPIYLVFAGVTCIPNGRVISLGTTPSEIGLGAFINSVAASNVVNLERIVTTKTVTPGTTSPKTSRFSAVDATWKLTGGS